MPATERRDAILDAVERLLGRGGVTAVTMRAVAEEAGVSLRLVQYYGKSKDELLTGALNRLADKSTQRWQDKTRELRQQQSGATPHIRAFLEEALPTDEASRNFHRLGVSLELMTITQPGVAANAYRAHLSALTDHLTDLLQLDSHMSAVDARRLASEVMAISHGVGSLLMAEQITKSQAAVLIDDYLDRLEPDSDS